MIKKVTLLITPIFFLTSFLFPTDLKAITAEDRLIEVEKKSLLDKNSRFSLILLFHSRIAKQKGFFLPLRTLKWLTIIAVHLSPSVLPANRQNASGKKYMIFFAFL